MAEKSYYERYMEERNARELQVQQALANGLPVENMGITGVSSALDGLQALIRDYKQSEAYQAKVAANQEERAEKREARKEERELKKLRSYEDKYDKQQARDKKKEEKQREKGRKKYDKMMEREGRDRTVPDFSKGNTGTVAFTKSPMKYGRADAALIAGVRRMNQAGKQYNAFSGVNDLVDRVALMKESVRKKAQKELDQYSVEETNNGFNKFKNGTNACTQYLSEQKKAMSDLKAKAENLNTNSPKFKQIKSEIIAIEDKWKGLNTQMTEVQTNRDDWANMHGKGEGEGNNDGRFRYSNATLDTPEYDYLNQIHSGQADMLISPNGQIQFVVGNMDASGQTSIVTLDQLNETIFERDEDGLGAFAKYREEVAKNQKENMPFSQGKAESLVNQLFGTKQDPNKKVMVSWMYDDLDGDGKTWIDDFTLEYPDVDISKYSAGANWSEPYDENQNIGEWLRDELKSYYVERLRGVHNDMHKANGKSTISAYGTGEYDLNYNNKNPQKSTSSAERIAAKKKKDQELAKANWDVAIKGGKDNIPDYRNPNSTWVKRDDGTYYKQLGNGNYVIDPDTKKPKVYTF